MADTPAFSPISRLVIWLGFAQGGVLYALYKTYQEAIWPVGLAPVFNALLLGALLLPFVVYWSHGILSGKPMRRLVGFVGALVLGLGAYQGMTVFPIPDMEKPQLVGFPVFAGLVLLSFMLVPLVSAWGGKGRAGLTLGRWDYARLFEHAWRNAVVTAQAGVLTGMFWIVLELGAQLFKLIGIDWPKHTIEEAWFAIPVTTLSASLGIRAGLRRAAFTHTLRSHWLTLTAWLLPIVSLIGSAFVLTSMAGVDTLFERGLSAFFLLWFAAFWVKFFNSAFQDGQAAPPFGGWLRRILSYTSLGLLVVAGFAAWALLLRISQHGLTPDRIWGAFVALVGLCYGVGYASSLLKKSRWMQNIAAANVVAALLMCTGIVLLLSPVLDARRLATHSQMDRFHSGKVKQEELDFYALAQQGSFGHAALASIAAQQDAEGKPTSLAIRATEAMQWARPNRYFGGRDAEKETPVASLQAQLDPYPSDTPLPEGFVRFLKTDLATWNKWDRQTSCFDRKNKNSRCSLLQIDLNRDGYDEIVLWKNLDDFRPWVYTQTGHQWKRLGVMQLDSVRNHASIQADLHAGEVASKAPTWNELRVGHAQFHVVEGARVTSED